MTSANFQSASFRGVWQIFVYNWHFYAAALVVDFGAALYLLRFSPRPGIRLSVYFAVALTTFWALSSLLVSHYVYDRSRLYQWTWLPALLGGGAGNWVTIHAGLDESSDSLLELFPTACPRMLDIYTPVEMSEPSIQRARQRAQSLAPVEKAKPSALPLQDGECDTIFLIFVAHELRKREARLQFFRELLFTARVAHG